MICFNIQQEINEAICFCKNEGAVCGTDGRTYASVCKMRQEAKLRDEDVGVKEWGPCETRNYLNLFDIFLLFLVIYMYRNVFSLQKYILFAAVNADADINVLPLRWYHIFRPMVAWRFIFPSMENVC